MQHVRNTHAGLLIQGPLDPGHSLLDACAQMHSTNDIKYLAPERCVSRLHEITQQKTPGWHHKAGMVYRGILLKDTRGEG